MNPHMQPLAELLARALERAGTRAWIQAEDEAALRANRAEERTAIVVGRILRTGSLSTADREALDAWMQSTVTSDVADALASGASALLDGLTENDLARRDDAESIAWFLGAAQATDAERRVVERARQMDETLVMRRDEWDVKPSPTRWLRRAAEIDASLWWLDLVALDSLRRRTNAKALFGATRAAGPLKLRRAHAKKAADLRVFAEVVGMEDDPARAAVERGAVIARLFSGELEVLAVGLRADQEDVPAGLCVRRASGGTEGIEAVALGATNGFASASGWWVPIAPDLTGVTQLVVRHRGDSESLAIEL